VATKALGATAAPGAEAGGPPPLLEARGIDFSYGPLQVLFGASIEVAPGGTVALLGTNGAGKSTLLRVIAGLLAPAAGAVMHKGDDVTGLRADQRVRRGMTLVEGGRATFPSLTVLENLRMGAYPFLAEGDLVDARLADVLELFPQLRDRLSQAAGTLSGGEQQMMAVGRALMSGADLLLIDELSLGLAPIVMQEIVHVVEELVRRGVTLVLVEQSLNVALGLTERAYFMEKGEVRFSGPTVDLLERGDLVRSVFFGKAE
jgi:ABC-type branched-subunit amino acid transport system ATPase component